MDPSERRVALFGALVQLPSLVSVEVFGAGGVILANVEDAATVEATINATRYQPVGTRSYGQQRCGLKDEPTDITRCRSSGRCWARCTRW